MNYSLGFLINYTNLNMLRCSLIISFDTNQYDFCNMFSNTQYVPVQYTFLSFFIIIRNSLFMFKKNLDIKSY